MRNQGKSIPKTQEALFFSEISSLKQSFLRRVNTSEKRPFWLTIDVNKVGLLFKYAWKN
jgi:hypothetical protein